MSAEVPIRPLFRVERPLGVVVLGAACARPAEIDKADSCTQEIWYRDVDEDGAGDPDGGYLACEAPAGHVADSSDCNDQDASVYPGAAELCNGVDDDCDAAIDDLEAGDSDGGEWFYADADGDGFGDPSAAVTGCMAPTGYVDNDADCDDSSAAIYPGADDVPRDGVDGDCDGADATSLAERVYVGDVNLLSGEDVSAFCAEYDGVVGDLQLAGASLPSALDLSCLVEVTGDIVVSTDTGTTLALPALWWVGADFRIAGNPSLVSLDVSSLRFIDGAVVLLDNAALGPARFPRLVTAGEVSAVDGADFATLRSVLGPVSLASGVTLDALQTVEGGISIRDGTMTAVSLPMLQQAGVVDLRSVSVQELDLGQLEASEGLALVLPALTGMLELPSLSVVSRDLVFDTSATSVRLDMLATVGGVFSVKTEVLEELDAAMLTSVGDDVDLGGASGAAVDVHALRSVDGALHIECPGCSTLDLSALSTVEGDVFWSFGDALETLQLHALASVGDGLVLLGADALTSFDAPLLESIGGECRLNDLASVVSIDLSTLEDPEEVVSIVNLPALSRIDLSGLRLRAIGGHVQVRDNPNLTALTLGSLEAASGALTIEANPQLTELDVSSLRTVGALVVAGPFSTFDSSALESTTGALELAFDVPPEPLDLSALVQVGGDFTLSGDLSEMNVSSLRIVGGGLTLQTSTLSDLDLSGLEEVFTDLTLELNSVVNADLSSLRTVGGSVTLLRGTVLASMELPDLEAVGSLTIEAMPLLTWLDLPSLTEPSGNLELVECDSLATMIGFAPLTGVQGSLILTGNDALADVTDLGGILSVGGDLLIQNNPSLSTSAAEGLVYDTIGVENIGGGVAIVGNGP